MNTEAVPPLAADYLRRLDEAAGRLPVDQARELAEDIREHLLAALGPDSSEAEVRQVLDRLGSPTDVVAAAGPVAPAPRAAYAAPTFGRVETGALIALIGAELLFVLLPWSGVVWLVGLILLSVSRWWTGREKTLGLLGLATGWPLSFLVVSTVAFTGSGTCSGSAEGEVASDGTEVVHELTQTCVQSGSSSHAYVAIACAVLYLGLQISTIWSLTRRSRRAVRLS